jgi:hypothetical protein
MMFCTYSIEASSGSMRTEKPVEAMAPFNWDILQEDEAILTSFAHQL